MELSICPFRDKVWYIPQAAGEEVPNTLNLSGVAHSLPAEHDILD